MCSRYLLDSDEQDFSFGAIRLAKEGLRAFGFALPKHLVDGQRPPDNFREAFGLGVFPKPFQAITNRRGDLEVQAGLCLGRW